MMSEHETGALGHVRILEFHKFFSEYTLWLQSGAERFRVKIRIYETNDGRFFFVQSHFVRTPAFEGGAVVTQLTHDTAHMALSTAADSITTYYEEGIAKGHEPNDGWFIPNDLF